MRLWSIHPRHLDARGLVALWREGLLARAVLAGATRGYRHHPQLERFRDGGVVAIDSYLHAVVEEAEVRGYRFDRSKLGACADGMTVSVTEGQLATEWAHLLDKLERRDPAKRAANLLQGPTPHPFFVVVPGPVEGWERGAGGLVWPAGPPPAC